MAVTTGFSIVSSYFKDDKEKYIGFMENALGLGFICGPIIGSLFYGFAGYSSAFYALAFIQFYTIIMICVYIPGSLNEEPEPESSYLGRTDSIYSSSALSSYDEF